MSEYCDIFPEDPTCAVEEEEVVVDEVVVEEETNTGDAEEGDNEEADAEEMDEEMEKMEEDMMEKMEKMDWNMNPSEMWMKAGDLMKFASIDPFMGEITYLMVAIGVTTSTALDLFRYRKADGEGYKAMRAGCKDHYDDKGVWTGNNYAKFGDIITKYTFLAVFGIASITQILAGLGIAPFVNMLVWGWGVMLLGSLVSFTGMIFKFIGYETAYSNMNDATYGAKNVAAMAAIKHMMVEDMAMETGFALSLYMQAENWHWAAWEKLT